MQISDEQENLPGWLNFWGEALTSKERMEATGVAKKAYAAGYEAAISLPVQPVAWRWPVEGGFIYCENKDEVLVEDGSEQPLYANPVPPTKGPEDDLIAAREAAASPCGIASPSYNDCPNMKEVGGGMEGERYWCALCSKGYFLDYEDMK